MRSSSARGDGEGEWHVAPCGCPPLGALALASDVHKARIAGASEEYKPPLPVPESTHVLGTGSRERRVRSKLCPWSAAFAGAFGPRINAFPSVAACAAALPDPCAGELRCAGPGSLR